MMKTTFFFFISFLFLLAYPSNKSFGAYHCVQPDGSGETSLQGALTIAETSGESDVIRVVQGFYKGNFNYYSTQGNSLTLLGGYTAGCTDCVMNPSNTILDGGSKNQALDLSNNDGGDITVKSFTIQHGSILYSSGGGIDVRSYSPSGTAGNILLSSNIIKENISLAYQGGGLFARSFSNTGHAGTVTLINNIIAANEASQGSGGGAFVSSESNSFSGETITFINNTITKNSANSNGGGIVVYIDDSTINVYNNIIRGNSASAGGDIYFSVLSGDPITNGFNNNYSEKPGSWDNGAATNIDIDPQFIDPDNGDFRLRSNSLCIDAGTNSVPLSPGLPSNDFEGDTRIINSTVDIGADEVSIITTCVKDASELQTILDAAEISGKDDIIMVAQGTYNGNFVYDSAEGYNITLLGGYTTGCASRVVNPSNTILDGEDSGRVLELSIDTGGGDIFVEGFTIRNGDVTSAKGAGVYAGTYSPMAGTAGDVTLTNNIITGNTTSAASGGGVYANSFGLGEDSGDITLTNNIVTGNFADDGSGGGITAQANSGRETSGTVTLANNTIIGNTADDLGGGVRLTMYDNTINFYNNVVWGNTATSSGDDIYLDGTGTASGYNNDYADMFGSWTNGTVTNINVDPKLSSNYHLRPSSPCIDAGTNSPPSGLPATDIDGDNRKIDGNRDSTADVDIGADEYVPKGFIAHVLLMLLN